MGFQALIPWAEADAQRDQARNTQWRDAQRTQTIADYMRTAKNIRDQLAHVDNLHKALALTLDPNTHQPAAGHEQEAARLREQLGQFDVNALHGNLNQVESYMQKLYDPNFNAQTGMEGRSPLRALAEKMHLAKPQVSPLMQPQAAGVDPTQYDTKLTPAEEQQFQQWKQKYAPNDSGQDYDLRGAFKAGLTPDPQTGHWPDTFKKPNHPTFSNQSMYAKQRPDLAGSWQGDQYIKPQPKPQTAGELIRGLRAIQQKYDIAAPGIGTGEKELESEAAAREQEQGLERKIRTTQRLGKEFGVTKDVMEGIVASELGGYKPVAPKAPKVRAIYQDQTGKQYQEFDSGEIATLGGDEVPKDVLNQLQLTPLSKTGAANLKLGTFPYFLNSAYGPNPTPQQQADARRIWAESSAIERQADGTVLWTDSNDQTWQIPTMRTTKPVPSGLTPPAPYQPPATPGPIQIGVGGQTFKGQQGAGAPVVQSITPTGTPQMGPTGATDVPVAPQSSIAGAAPTPTGGAGPTPPVPGARRLGTKRSPEETAAAKVADQMETDVNAVNDYMKQRRAGQKSATSDTTIVLSWVRAQVRGAGRMTNPEIEQGLQSGSYATRFLNAYNRAKDGTLDDSFIEQMVGDITRAANAARQTADKYKSGGGVSGTGIVPAGTMVYDPSGKSYKADGTHPLPQGWSMTPPARQ